MLGMFGKRDLKEKLLCVGLTKMCIDMGLSENEMNKILEGEQCKTQCVACACIVGEQRMKTQKLIEKINEGTPFESMKPVLSDAALKWWNGLPTFRRIMFMNMHYSDDFPSNDRIMTLYKIYKDDETDTYEDFGSCR